MLYASKNAYIAFMMFRFDQVARSVARDVAAGWLEHSVDLEHGAPRVPILMHSRAYAMRANVAAPEDQ
jgi:hypothetical protein